MKKVTFLISFILILSMGLIGCAPKGDPTEVLNKYFDNLKNNNADAMYEYLSSVSKNNWTKEKFNEFLSVSQEISPNKDVKIEKTNEYKNKDLDGVIYKNVVEYNITETDHDNFEGKDVQVNYVRNVVNENGEWKVYRGKEDPKGKIAQSKLVLANMYSYGKGENKDLNQAAIILNESINENPEYSGSYYLLGVIYGYLERYDEVIEKEQQFLEKEKDDKSKSDGYNVLGKAYESKNNYIKAKECYSKAIELNPNNEYAKTNINKYANIQLNNNTSNNNSAISNEKWVVLIDYSRTNESKPYRKDDNNTIISKIKKIQVKSGLTVDDCIQRLIVGNLSYTVTDVNSTTGEFMVTAKGKNVDGDGISIRIKVNSVVDTMFVCNVVMDNGTTTLPGRELLDYMGV